jgi:hypothetical protein
MPKVKGRLSGRAQELDSHLEAGRAFRCACLRRRYVWTRIQPSNFNGNRKRVLSVWKAASRPNRSVNLLDTLRRLGPAARPLKLALLDGTFRARLPRADWTPGAGRLSADELPVRERLRQGLDRRCRLPDVRKALTGSAFELLIGSRRAALREPLCEAPPADEVRSRHYQR